MPPGLGLRQTAGAEKVGRTRPAAPAANNRRLEIGAPGACQTTVPVACSGNRRRQVSMAGPSVIRGDVRTACSTVSIALLAVLRQASWIFS